MVGWSGVGSFERVEGRDGGDVEGGTTTVDISLIRGVEESRCDLRVRDKG